MRRVASRHHLGFWLMTDRVAIADARYEYDEGRIELVTKREGAEFVLYAIDRVKPAPRRPYFSSHTEE